MKILAMIAVLALSACAGDRSAAIRDAAKANVEIWAAQGVDIQLLNPGQQMLAYAGCLSLTSISSVVRPDAPELSSEAAEWCNFGVSVAGARVQ